MFNSSFIKILIASYLLSINLEAKNLNSQIIDFACHYTNLIQESRQEIKNECGIGFGDV